MMHLKTTNLSGFIKIIAVTAVVLVFVLLGKSIFLRDGVQAIVSIDYKRYQEDICKIMIHKTIPAVGIAMENDTGGNSSQFIAYTLFKYITKVDFKNPRSYLLSQIPLLGLFDITNFNGLVDGTSGSRADNNQQKVKEETPSGNNFDSKPVENAKVDVDKPGVILYHTHTTESYLPTPQFAYEAFGDHRTTDRLFNVCRVGEEMKSYLETYFGIAVAHDMTLHDYPSYDGSYNKSKPTVENLVKKYPDVKYIIDVHRDAFPDDESARKSMVAEIRGERAAKVMFVIGKSNPHWQENYYMALKLNQKIEELYPGLSKGILVRDKSIYNQDISNKSVLIEMGADCNTMEEVLVSAKMVARALGQTIKGN